MNELKRNRVCRRLLLRFEVPLTPGEWGTAVKAARLERPCTATLLPNAGNSSPTNLYGPQNRPTNMCDSEEPTNILSSLDWPYLHQIRTSSHNSGSKSISRRRGSSPGRFNSNSPEGRAAAAPAISHSVARVSQPGGKCVFRAT